MLFSVPAKPFPPPIKLIIFMLGVKEHQAEEGMTWEEWVGSVYSEGSNLKVQFTDGTVCTTDGSYTLCIGKTPVSSSDLIIDGMNYVLTIQK